MKKTILTAALSICILTVCAQTPTFFDFSAGMSMEQFDKYALKYGLEDTKTETKTTTEYYRHWYNISIKDFTKNIWGGDFVAISACALKNPYGIAEEIRLNILSPHTLDYWEEKIQRLFWKYDFDRIYDYQTLGKDLIAWCGREYGEYIVVEKTPPPSWRNWHYFTITLSMKECVGHWKR